MSRGTPLTIGLIGAGRWGRVYLRTLASLQERCRLTHLATSRPEAASLYPQPVAVTPDWRALIRAECDAVIIATPPTVHAEMVEACLEARKPCIVEKPLCLDPETAETLRRRIDASGVPVLVDHTHLFHPAYEALKRALAASREPIRTIVSEGMGFGPFRPDVSALWDWGPHDVSLYLDLMGTRPEHVEALGGPEGRGGQPEAVSARLDFPDGACAWLHVSRLSPQKRRTLVVTTDSRSYWLDELAVEPLTAARLPQPDGTDPDAGTLKWEVVPVASSVLPLTAMLTYFLEGLSGKDRSRFGAGLACDVVRVLADCDESLKRGRSRSSLPN
jgi:predicted dehydrogenase